MLEKNRVWTKIEISLTKFVWYENSTKYHSYGQSGLEQFCSKTFFVNTIGHMIFEKKKGKKYMGNFKALEKISIEF